MENLEELLQAAYNRGYLDQKRNAKIKQDLLNGNLKHTEKQCDFFDFWNDLHDNENKLSELLKTTNNGK